MLKRWIIESKLSVSSNASRPIHRVLKDPIGERHDKRLAGCANDALAGCFGSCFNGERYDAEFVIERSCAVGWGTARIAFSREVFMAWETWS